MDFYPLSPMQQGMLFHSLYAPASGVYFEQGTLTLEGALDHALFRAAWERLVARHPILRTTFVWDNVKEPVQVVHDRIDLVISSEDWRDLSERDREERLNERLASDRARGFDLANGPLLRLAVFRTGDARHEVLFSWHHLLMDGWSVPLVLDEVLTSYEALRRGVEPDRGSSGRRHQRMRRRLK